MAARALVAGASCTHQRAGELLKTSRRLHVPACELGLDRQASVRQIRRRMFPQKILARSTEDMSITLGIVCKA